MRRTPCYKCEERHEGCHSDCERYADWDREHQAFNDKKARAKTAEQMIEGFYIDSGLKRQKQKGVR